MPLIFREDENGDLRYSGYATVAYTSDAPTEHVVDDLGPGDLPAQPRRLTIAQHPGQDRQGRDVRGEPDDPTRHSRHMRAGDVTLAESDPPDQDEE